LLINALIFRVVCNTYPSIVVHFQLSVPAGTARLLRLNAWPVLWFADLGRSRPVHRPRDQQSPLVAALLLGLTSRGPSYRVRCCVQRQQWQDRGRSAKHLQPRPISDVHGEPVCGATARSVPARDPLRSDGRQARRRAWDELVRFWPSEAGTSGGRQFQPDWC
jgi:hypothetical protein